MWIAVAYLWAINALTLLAFGWDKLRARRRRKRLRERTLLWFAVLGGSPAALVERWIFGHKTRKRRFTFWLLCILGAQAGVCYFLLSEDVTRWFLPQA